MAKTKAELEAELEAVRQENARLKTVSAPLPGSKASRRWRTFGAVALITIGTLLAPAAVVGGWAKNQLSSTEQFVDTFAPLASSPAVQSFISKKVSTAIIEGVDVDGLTSELFSGLETLPLPERAADALQLLAGPAAEGVKSLVSGAVERFVTSDVFQTAVRETLTLTHEQALAVIQGDPDAAVQLADDGTISLQLGPVIEKVKVELVKQGFGFASAIPAVDLSIVIAQSDNLALIRPLYALSVALGYWLPWLALGLVAAGVLLAVRRTRALFGASIALAAVFTSLAAGFDIARLLFVATVSPRIMPVGAAEAIYLQLTDRMQATAVAAAVMGLALALVTWFLALPSAAPIRAWIVSGIDSVRASAEAKGVTTGRFGSALWRYRLPVRIAIGAVAGVVLLFVRPLSIELTVWTMILSLLAVLLVESLGRPEAAATAVK